MSYILDALRRADAERERGAVPSLHAQQQFALGEGDGESEGRPKMLWWVVGGLGAVLIAVVAWIWLGSASPSAVVASAPATAQPVSSTPPPGPAAAPQSPAPAPPLAAVTPPPQGAPAPASSQSPVPPPTRRAARAAKANENDDGARADGRTKPRATAPTEARTSSRSEARTSEPTVATNATRRTNPGAEPGTPREAPRERDAAPEAHRAAQAPRSAATAEGRIVPQRELPEDVRRSLPNFKVSGSAYSSDPSSRMLMINGQIFREGDPVAGGVVLKQIRPKAAVFEFKGYRYEMAF